MKVPLSQPYYTNHLLLEYVDFGPILAQNIDVPVFFQKEFAQLGAKIKHLR